MCTGGWDLYHICPKVHQRISKYVTKSVQLCKLVCPTVASRLCNLVNAPVLQYLLRVSPNVTTSGQLCHQHVRMFYCFTTADQSFVHVCLTVSPHMSYYFTTADQCFVHVSLTVSPHMHNCVNFQNVYFQLRHHIYSIVSSRLSN